VEVELDPVAGLLQVSDDGPQRSGSPGNAAPGSVQPLRMGLGHRVVEKVAALHGATFEPDVPLPGPRRGWRIHFPAPETDPLQA
jgi:two-component system sensor histidine kinase QseC